MKVGRVASSDAWLDNADLVLKESALHSTLCEDMEAAAIACVAESYEIPFVAIKDVSNSVFLNEAEQFDGHSHIVPTFAGRSAAVMVALMCEALGSQKTCQS